MGIHPVGDGRAARHESRDPHPGQPVGLSARRSAGQTGVHRQEQPRREGRDSDHDSLLPRHFRRHARQGTQIQRRSRDLQQHERRLVARRRTRFGQGHQGCEDLRHRRSHGSLGQYQPERRRSRHQMGHGHGECLGRRPGDHGQGLHHRHAGQPGRRPHGTDHHTPGIAGRRRPQRTLRLRHQGRVPALRLRYADAAGQPRPDPGCQPRRHGGDRHHVRETPLNPLVAPRARSRRRLQTDLYQSLVERPRSHADIRTRLHRL